MELGATFMLGYELQSASCLIHLDGDQPQGARSVPVASLPFFSSLPLQSGWGCQEHPGLARQRDRTWQRSLEIDDKSPGKRMQGYGLG